MRVLLLFSSGQLGGAERSLSRMAFATNEVEYQLATLGGEGPWSEWVSSLGFSPLVFGQGLSSGIWHMLDAFRRLIRYIHHNPVDVIYVCGVRAAFILRLIRFLFPGLKLIHGVRWNPNSSSRLDRFFRLIELFTHHLCDAWITNSEIAKQTLVKRCRISDERIFVIHNGLESVPDKVPLINERPLEVLTIANLSPRKGHLEFLKVIREIITDIPEARFIFVGRDDMKGKVQQAIVEAGLADFVRCVGFQSDVTSWFRRARVFVLPSLWNEGCPTAILEAMSFSVPCIAFELDGIPELVQSGQQGVLLRYRDYQGMTDAISQLLKDTKLASKYGNSGRVRVKSQFVLENTVDLHWRAFKTVLSRANK